MKELIDLLSKNKLHRLLNDNGFYNQRYNSALKYEYNDETRTCFCFSPSVFILNPHVYKATWKKNVSVDLDTEIENIKEDYISLLKESLFSPFVDQQFEEDIFTNSFHVPANKNMIWILTVGTLIRYIWENPGRVNIMLHLHKLGFTPNVSIFFGHFIDEKDFNNLNIRTPNDLGHSLFPMYISQNYSVSLSDIYSYKIIPTYKSIIKNIESYLKNQELRYIFLNRCSDIFNNKITLKNIETLTLEDAKIFSINHFGDNE